MAGSNTADSSLTDGIATNQPVVSGLSIGDYLIRRLQD